MRPTLFQLTANFLNGYDFFISYTRRPSEGLPSGEYYANQLCDQLEQIGFRCFLDRNGLAPGDRWWWVVQRKLRMTSQLLVVVSPMALEAPAVVDEVKAFSRKQNARVIPIDFDGTIKHRDAKKPLLQHLSEEVVFLEEPNSALETGPSRQIIQRIQAGFDLTRQETKRARIYSIAAIIFAMISILAIIGGAIAKINGDRAIENAWQASRNLIQTYTNQGIEKAEQDNQVEAAAYFSQALKEAADLDVNENEALESRLYSTLRSGRFAPLEAMLEHEGNVTGAIFSPNGKYLLAATSVDLARLWRRNENSWTQVGEDHAHDSNFPKAIAFSQDGSRFATSFNGVIEISDTESGKTSQPPIDVNQQVSLLVFNEAGDALLVALGGKKESELEITIIELETGRAVDLDEAIPSKVESRSIFVSHDGSLAVVQKYLVELNKPYKVRRLPIGEYGWINAVGFVPSQELIFIDDSHQIYALDLKTFNKTDFSAPDYGDSKPEEFLRGRSGEAFSMNYMGKILLREEYWELTGGRYANLVAKFDYSNPDYRDPEFMNSDAGEKKREIKFIGARFTDNRKYTLSPKGGFLLSYLERQGLRIWDPDTHVVISPLLPQLDSAEITLFNDDETLLLSTTGDHFIRIWDLSLLRRLDSVELSSLPIESPHWLPYFISLPYTEFDANLVNKDSKLVDETGRYQAIGLSGDMSNAPAWAIIKDVANGKTIAELKHTTREISYIDDPTYGSSKLHKVLGLAFNSDNKFLATLSVREEEDGEKTYLGVEPARLRVWDVKTGFPITEWIDLNQNLSLPNNVKEGLSSPLLDASPYQLQPLSLSLTDADDLSQIYLELRIGDELIQRISIKPTIDRNRLIQLSDALTGIRIDSAKGKPIMISEQERIKLWRQIRKLPAVQGMLNISYSEEPIQKEAND